jgi:hypothetical protein
MRVPLMVTLWTGLETAHVEKKGRGLLLQKHSVVFSEKVGLIFPPEKPWSGVLQIVTN